MSKRICYYVSGHGFGHATRVSQICQALLAVRGNVHITICTKAPRYLFPASPRVQYRDREVDSRIVQPLPYDIDVLSTFQDLERFCESSQSWAREEAAFIEESGFDLLLVDAPWSIGLLQDTSEKCPPIVLVSNFSFDLIYERLLAHVPEDTPPTKQDTYRELITHIIDAYRKFNHLIRLPGYIDFPFLQNHETCTVTDAPLIYRPPRQSRLETLAALGLPSAVHNHKILLVQFGGHLASDAMRVPKLPKDWICLINSSIDHPDFFSFPSDFYLPDLVHASDLVLGKIGYGTVSECIGIGKPLLYVSREMFAEEPYLLRYMQRVGSCRELSRTHFEQGSWDAAIETLYQDTEELKKQRSLGCEDGSIALAEMIYTLID